eukprot:8307662-Pyramimonas_sp.AAC.1
MQASAHLLQLLRPHQVPREALLLHRLAVLPMVDIDCVAPVAPSTTPLTMVEAGCAASVSLGACCLSPRSCGTMSE